jgi:two-component system chemotaxis response regulator CheB
VPIVVVQHMPPLFTALLAERLSAQSSIKVHEGTSGTVLLPGHAYVAPGDRHMIVTRDGTQRRLLLHQDPPENSCRPAVDPLFRSVAQAYGAGALAVVLTGMGQDGLRGCQVLRGAGAQILAQDEATSVVWGMPGAVARAGLADRVLPLAMIAPEVVQRIRSRR